MMQYGRMYQRLLMYMPFNLTSQKQGLLLETVSKIDIKVNSKSLLLILIFFIFFFFLLGNTALKQMSSVKDILSAGHF